MKYRIREEPISSKGRVTYFVQECEAVFPFSLNPYSWSCEETQFEKNGFAGFETLEQANAHAIGVIASRRIDKEKQREYDRSWPKYHKIK